MKKIREKKTTKNDGNSSLKITKKDCKNEPTLIQRIISGRKKMKKESMQEISNGICLKKYGKEYRKNQYQKVFIEDRQKKKQMKKYQKN